MKHLKQYHLEKDLKLTKLTLQRWLQEQQAAGEACEEAAVLLNRWTRRYTAAEVRTLLKLGKMRYRGDPGMEYARREQLRLTVEGTRKTIVKRVTSLLK